jgi:hypothetical protein
LLSRSPTQKSWTLNIGCGPDDWGDVRLDLAFETQTGLSSRLNVRADAQALPFREEAFLSCRCWHVLEHVDNPFQVVREILRVSSSADVRFPVDDGYKKHLLIYLINLDLTGFLNAFRTLRRRAHIWIINPASLSSMVPRARVEVSDRRILLDPLSRLSFGRKGRLLRKVFRRGTVLGGYRYEWKVFW